MKASAAAISALALLLVARASFAQGPPAQSPRAAAPIDLTGYWVSIVSEDWRYRMVTPTKGDFQGVPVTPDAVKAANDWNPETDTAAGNQCRSYGAPAILRVPGRLHITWDDDRTLKLEADAGTQTRLFQFGKPSPAPARRTWQGSSVAVWEARRANNPAPSARYLKVTTTNMLAGYLRKNGVPYGESAVLTEYFDLFREKDGTTMMFVTAVVQDPVYLEQRYIVISHFRKEPDGSKWDPTPCSARW